MEIESLIKAIIQCAYNVRTLNDHNKQEYPPMHTDETHYLIF